MMRTLRQRIRLCRMCERPRPDVSMNLSL